MKKLLISFMLVLALMGQAVAFKYDSFEVSKNVESEDDCIEIHSFEENIYLG